MFEARYGKTHLEVAATLGGLAVIDARRENFEPAEQRLRRALYIKEQHLGTEDVELVPTLGTLGVVRRRQGADHEARMLYKRALELLHGRVAPDHPQVAKLRANLRRLELRGDETALAQSD